MRKYQTSVFNKISMEEIEATAAKCKADGLAFVQVCATTLEESCELLYAFNDASAEEPGMIGFVVEVPDGAHVPSITPWFPAAFVFENEAHDLFGLNIDGINIDFEGEFYQVAVAYPMNPRMADEAGEEAENE